MELDREKVHAGTHTLEAWDGAGVYVLREVVGSVGLPGAGMCFPEVASHRFPAWTDAKAAWEKLVGRSVAVAPGRVRPFPTVEALREVYANNSTEDTVVHWPSGGFVLVSRPWADHGTKRSVAGADESWCWATGRLHELVFEGV